VITGVNNEESFWEKQKMEIHEQISSNMIFCIATKNIQVFLFPQNPFKSLFYLAKAIGF